MSARQFGVTAMLMLRVYAVAAIVLIALLLGAMAPASAQQVADGLSENTVDLGNMDQTGESAGQQDAFDGAAFKAQSSFMLTVSAITAGLMVFTLAILLAIAWRTGLSAEFTRTLILVVIVFAALYLISAGYSNEQAAPVYGLLGTIAGYLFGRAQEPQKPSTTPTAVVDGQQPATKMAVTPGPGEGS